MSKDDATMSREQAEQVMDFAKRNPDLRISFPGAKLNVISTEGSYLIGEKEPTVEDLMKIPFSLMQHLKIQTGDYGPALVHEMNFSRGQFKPDINPETATRDQVLHVREFTNMLNSFYNDEATLAVGAPAVSQRPTPTVTTPPAPIQSSTPQNTRVIDPGATMSREQAEQVMAFAEKNPGLRISFPGEIHLNLYNTGGAFNGEEPTVEDLMKIPFSEMQEMVIQTDDGTPLAQMMFRRGQFRPIINRDSLATDQIPQVREFTDMLNSFGQEGAKLAVGASAVSQSPTPTVTTPVAPKPSSTPQKTRLIDTGATMSREQAERVMAFAERNPGLRINFPNARLNLYNTGGAFNREKPTVEDLMKIPFSAMPEMDIQASSYGPSLAKIIFRLGQFSQTIDSNAEGIDQVPQVREFTAMLNSFYKEIEYTQEFTQAIEKLEKESFTTDDTEMKKYIDKQEKEFKKLLNEGNFDQASELIKQMDQNATKLAKEPGVNFIKRKVDEMHEKKGFFSFGRGTKACSIANKMKDVPIEARLKFSLLPKANDPQANSEPGFDKVMEVRKELARHRRPFGLKSTVKMNEDGTINEKAAAQLFKDFKKLYIDTLPKNEPAPESDLTSESLIKPPGGMR